MLLALALWSGDEDPDMAWIFERYDILLLSSTQSAIEGSLLFLYYCEIYACDVNREVLFPDNCKLVN